MDIRNLEKRIKKLERAKWGFTHVIMHGQGQPLEIRDSMSSQFRIIQPDDPEYRKYMENKRKI